METSVANLFNILVILALFVYISILYILVVSNSTITRSVYQCNGNFKEITVKQLCQFFTRINNDKIKAMESFISDLKTSIGESIDHMITHHTTPYSVIALYHKPHASLFIEARTALLITWSFHRHTAHDDNLTWNENISRIYFEYLYSRIEGALFVRNR